MYRTDMPEKKCVPRRLCALAGGLALAGLAVAGPPQGGAAEDTAHARHRGTVYHVVNLGAGEVVGAAAINARDQVAYALAHDIFSPIRAFFYDGRSALDIGDLGAGFARATGLNNAGQVTGVSSTPAGKVRSFIWSRRGGMVDLGTLPGADEAWEPSINSRGVVAGYVSSPTMSPRAFRWSASGGMEDLGVLAGGANGIAYARALNDAGAIVGDSWKAGHDYHAFMWTRSGGMVDIDTIGLGDSSPIAISARGLVAGNYWYGGDVRGFAWTRRDGMRDLGTGGGDGTWLVGMSASGQVAGMITTLAGGNRAMTWTSAGGLVDLGTLGGSRSAASAANNRGQVVGGALTAGDAEYRAFVWSAREGMVDLNSRLCHPPAGLTLHNAVAISDNGAIVAHSNAGLVLLKPAHGHARSAAAGTSVGPIVSADLVALGTPLKAEVGVASEDPAARHTVSWSWGDGNTARSPGTRAGTDAGRSSGSHAYGAPGIYTVTANVVDSAGARFAVSRQVVVYDPSQAMAAGSGSFLVPHWNGKSGTPHAGKARLNFVAPSAQGVQSTDARGGLYFSVAGLNFHSTDLRPVASSAAGRLFEGSGTLNGTGRHHVRLVATAPATGSGTPATVKLRIWHADPATGKEVVDFDSQALKGDAAGAALVEGGIAL